MQLRKAVPAKPNVQNKRRGVRINSRVPVAVEWVGEDGKAIRAEAHTRIVNFYGCLVVLPHNLRLEQRVQLTNLATNQSLPAVVVWKGNERSEGWEIGLELVRPEMDFWGLDL